MSKSTTSSPAEDESQPLLTNHASEPQPEKRKCQFLPVPVPVPNRILIPILGLLTIFLNEAEFYIKSPAQVRAIESMACYEYYSSINSPLAKYGKNIPELQCKLTRIQERVATITGIAIGVRMVSAVLGTFLILTLFKAGRRRPVMILHKANLVVYMAFTLVAYFGYPRLPIWFITLGGLTGLFGGNYDLGTSMIFAAYADVIPDPTRRSNLIFISTSLQYAAQALCMPFTSRLMSLHGEGSTPYVSFFVGMGCCVSAFCLNAFLFPETFRPEQQQQAGDQRNQDNDGAGSNPSGLPSENASKPAVPKPSSGKPFSILRNDFGLARMLFILLAMFCSTASTRLVEWYGVLQYPSVKFNWTLSKTTYMICMQAILSFANFAFVLPTINRVCQRKYQVSARLTSVGIVVGSSLLLMLCSIAFGLPGTTSTIFIIAAGTFSLGTGVNSALQTYIVSVASSPRSSGAALTVVSLAATCGKVLASVIWPAALTIGLEHPSGKLGGLPFFVVAIFFVAVAASILCADQVGRLKKSRSVIED